MAGVDPADLADPAAALAGLEKAEFVVSIEQRLSLVTERADVVFPAALLEEQSGHFLNWEHRHGRVRVVNKNITSPMTDLRILAALADALGSEPRLPRRQAGLRRPDRARRLGRRARTATPPRRRRRRADGGIRLAWRELLDASQGNDFELALRATARPAVARVSPPPPSASASARWSPSSPADVASSSPCRGHPGMVDDVVWVPLNPNSVDRLPATPGAPAAVAAVSVDEGA